MNIGESVRAYLERGGVIHRVPGFERVAPLPGRRVKETPAPAPEPAPAEKKPVELSEAAASLTLEQISSRHLVRLSLLKKLYKAGHLPAPDAHGFNGKRRWSGELAQEVVRIADEALDAAERQKSREMLESIRASQGRPSITL